MIFLRLVYVLHVRVRGSKFDTYQNLACIRVFGRKAYNDELHVTEILVSALSGELLTFEPLFFT
jgi:hypothetical protein